MEWQRDQSTGDYVQDANGRPVMDSTLAAPVRTRLRAHRQHWLHAPDDQWGSDFYSYLRKKSVNLKDGLGESIATRALDPLVQDGRADNLEVDTQFTQRGGVAFSTTLLDRQRQEEYTVVTPVGVPL